MSHKVGIVTFHNHSNYGAALQAYGLKHVLEEMGVEVYFVCDDRKKGKEPQNKDEQKPIEEMVASAEDKRVRRIMDATRRLSDKTKKIQKQLFSDFAFRYFKQINLSEVREKENEFAFFLAGSDQIWNFEITGVDSFWFLDFAPKEKCFSYAASFGMTTLPEKGKLWYRKQLQHIEEISVREESGVQIVDELLGREAVVCPDPVFLPEVSDWEKLKKECQESVVVYMTEFDAGLYNEAQKQAKKMGLPFVYIGYANLGVTGFSLVHCDPQEWLGYLYHARVVYTNSFHGCAFSLLFHKKLFYKPLVMLAKRNERVKSLFQKLCIEPVACRERPDIFEISFESSWESTDIKIEEMRECGRKYLRNTVSRFQNVDE